MKRQLEYGYAIGNDKLDFLVYDNDEIEVRSVRPRLRRLAILFYPIRWLYSKKITTVKIEELKKFIKHYETVNSRWICSNCNSINDNTIECPCELEELV